MITVLIVEDSPVARDFLQHILSADPDIQVIGTAHDGEAAIDAVQRRKPDVITMDIYMPKMNGFEAVRHIRQHSEVGTTPIIMVTTRGEMENVETGFSSGCNDYVTKPINAPELMTKLKALLG